MQVFVLDQIKPVARDMYAYNVVFKFQVSWQQNNHTL